MTVALVALLCGFTANRDPGGDAIVWQAPVVTMSLQADGSDDIDDGTDLAVMREALSAWSAACSDFAYVEGAPTASRAFDPTDGINTVTFLEDEWPAFAFGAIGFAPEAIDTSALPHRRVGVDVILNGFELEWATDADPTCPDVGGVVTHELGHALGLWHSSDTDATMYFGSKRGGTQARILAADDLRGLCFLYPRDPFECLVDEDCPLFYGNGGRTRCVAGACVAGTVGFGLDCSDAGQCQSGACIESRYTPGGNPGFCSRACDPVAQDCPTGLCSELSGAPLCYPHRETCVLDDEECGGAPWQCVWDLDLAQRCLLTCASDGECGAAAGSVCDAGWCRSPGPAPAGATCENSAACQSLRCGGPGPTCLPLSGADGARDGGDADGGDDDWNADGDPSSGDLVAGDPDGDVGDSGREGDGLRGDPSDVFTDGAFHGDDVVPLIGGGVPRPPAGIGCACDGGAPVCAPVGAMVLVWWRRRFKRGGACASERSPR